MYGKLLNTIINIMFITYLLLLVSFYFLHEGIKENINNINYTTVDTVSTQGIFNVDVYNNLKERVFNYAGSNCNYIMTIKYEQKVAPGVYTSYFIKDTINVENIAYPSDEDVLNKVDPSRIITVSNRKPFPMYKGDRLTIYLEDQNQTLYGKLITMPFMGMLDNYTDFRIKSLKASMIGTEPKKLVNGYDVIDEINDSSRTYNCELITEMSTLNSQPNKTFAPGVIYDESQAEFGSTSGIEGSYTATIGVYHVFGTLDYYRVWEDINLNGFEDAGDNVLFYQTTD